MTFDDLWEQEERKGLQRRLQREYPVWQRQHKRRRTAAAVAVAVLAVLSPLTFSLQQQRPYDAVSCNRSGIDDAHWADVASNILSISTI